MSIYNPPRMEFNVPLQSELEYIESDDEYPEEDEEVVDMVVGSYILFS